MRTQGARFGLVVGLTVLGLACGGWLWASSARTTAARSMAAQFDEHISGILGSLVEIGSAQALYVAPGQAGGPWPARVTTSLARVSGHVEGLRSTGDEDLARAVRESVDRLVAADAQVQQQLERGDFLTATDLLSNAARDTLTGVGTRVRDVAEQARGRRAAEARNERVRGLAALGGTVVLWLVGLIVLARAGATPVPASHSLSSSEALVPAATQPTAAPTTAFDAEVTAASSGPPIDVMAAAGVSAAIARLTDAAQIQDLLAQAADVLDAQGAIVWLNTGARLQAVASHGYDPRVLARVGDIEKDAEHVTAEAWREAALRTITAYDSQSAGAIVAPMVAHDGCRGVLSLEVRHGREGDATARAIALMFASQLAGVVAPAPAAQAAPAGPAGPADELAS